MELTDKQKRFCEEYRLDFNGKQAAIRAGYSEKTAEVQASRLLSNANVQKYISGLKQEIREDNQLTAQMVIDELAKIAFHNVQDFVNGGNSVLELKYIDRNKAAAVSGIKTTVRKSLADIETTTDLKFHSKEKALELLGRHFGIFEKDNEQGKVKIEVALSKQEAKEISDALEEAL